MEINTTYLTCKKVRFYAPFDEDIFFRWIKKIKCIKSFEGAGDELYLDLIEEPLTYHDVKDLIALLYRYEIDMTQLQPFMNDQNKNAFKPWRRQIFPIKRKTNILKEV